jgi:hypothetical protein
MLRALQSCHPSFELTDGSVFLEYGSRRELKAFFPDLKR